MWTLKPLLKIPSKRYYANLLYGLNILHIIVGVLCFGLALSQFAPVNLGSTFVDFRLLNFIHVVTGAAGLHMLTSHFGSVAVGALYCTSFSLSFWTCAFYSYSCAEEVRFYKSLIEIRTLQDGEVVITDTELGNQIGKIIICSVMIFLAVSECIICLASGYALNKLASDSYSNLKQARRSSHTRQMAFVALMKSFFSLATLALGAYLESLYKAKGHFVKIGWQELSGCVGLVSAIVDLRALYSDKRNLLYLKIAMVVGVSSATFSLKTLDYAMVNHFVIDLRDYTQFDITAGFSENDRHEVFVRFVVHACVIACLVLVFAHSVISAVECASYVEWSSAPLRNDHTAKVDKGWRVSRNRLGFMQILCGLGTIALTVISLVSTWNFSKGYEGGPGILWLGCLFTAAGCVTSGRARTFATAVYVVACICSILALEYSLYSLNFIFQAVRNPKFQNELADPTDEASYSTHVGRIVLYSLQAGLLLLEFFTATYTAYTFGYAVKRLPMEPTTKSYRIHGSLCFLSFFHLIYSLVTVAVSVANEVVIWKYSIPVQPAVVVTNGVVVFVCVIIQCMTRRKRQFLIPSAVLNAVCASIAFFVIVPYTTNLYNQVAAYRTAEEMHQFDSTGGADSVNPVADGRQKRVMHEWIIGLTALILCLAAVEYVVAVVSGMICSYALHNIHQPTTSDLRFSTMRSQPPALPHYFNGVGNGTVPLSTVGKYVGSVPRPVGGSRRSNAGGQQQQQQQERYFGSNYRTYAEQMYNPNEILFVNGGGAGRESQYGAATAVQHLPTNRSRHGRESSVVAAPPTTKVNNHAQTNIRHVFNTAHSRYMAPY